MSEYMKDLIGRVEEARNDKTKFVKNSEPDQFLSLEVEANNNADQSEH